MKNKKYHNVKTIPKSNIKIVERGQIDKKKKAVQLEIQNYML